MMVRMLIIMRN